LGKVQDDQKRGPFSKQERAFIAKFFGELSYEEIAKKLKRNPKRVRKYIDANHSSIFQERAKDAEYNIQGSPVWKDIDNQLAKEEKEMFLYHWGRIISQFKDDVFPTEQMQVIDTVKLEILMNRSLRQQQECLTDIKLQEVTLNQEYQLPPEDQDKQVIYNAEKQIGILRAAQESLGKNYHELLTKKNSILKEMKATRDARIKSIEASKHSFAGWMRRLLESTTLRAKLGRDLEKMRIATNVEFERLSEYHEYADGELDQPFLTPENILDE